MRRPAAQLVNFETTSRLVSHVQTFTFSFGSQENVIFRGCVHRLRKGRFELNCCSAVFESSGTEILKPVFRSFHGVQRDSPLSLIHRNYGRLRAGTEEVAADVKAADSTEEFAISPQHRSGCRGSLIVLQIERGVEGAVVYGVKSVGVICRG